MKVLIDTSPLTNANAIRGIGTYTRCLTKYLEQEPQVEVKRTSQKQQEFEPDVIHYPFFDLFFSTLPLVRSKPTVVTVHDVIPLRYPDQYDPGFKGQVKLSKQKIALGTTDAVITDSEASKKDIEQYLGIDPDKIHVVYLAGNPELEAKDDQQINQVKEKYDLPDKYLLYVGDINYNKNLPQLIKALKYLPNDLNLVLLGKNFKEQDIPEWRWIEAQIAMSDVEDRIIFLNKILGEANDELAAIYSGAVAYVQPSLYEGFGLPVLEAMQCQTPVVSSNQGSLPEVAGDHAIYTEPEAEALANGVEQILAKTVTERTQMTKSAYKWSQTFSWEKTAQETIRVYQQLTS
jgi:glycosyltransferase involved in cell wall biosynthesis